MAASEIICYIQPCNGFAKGTGTAWADTSKTATVRRHIATKSEAESVIAEAVEIARAMGGNMVVKTIARAIYGARRPAGVKALQGSQVIA